MKNIAERPHSPKDQCINHLNTGDQPPPILNGASLFQELGEFNFRFNQAESQILFTRDPCDN